MGSTYASLPPLLERLFHRLGLRVKLPTMVEYNYGCDRVNIIKLTVGINIPKQTVLHMSCTSISITRRDAQLISGVEASRN